MTLDSDNRSISITIMASIHLSGKFFCEEIMEVLQKVLAEGNTK